MSEKENDFNLTDRFKEIGQRRSRHGEIKQAILDAMSWYEKNHGDGLYTAQIFELISQKRIKKYGLQDSSRISSTIGYMVRKNLIERRKDKKYYLVKLDD